MVVDKFAKLFCKKKNRHNKCHPQPNEELSSSSLHAFHSHVSKHINQLAVELKPESENLSLSWFLRCFGLFPIIDKAFAKLVMDIDYPMSQWDADSIEGYLNYTMNLLELLNSISSSLSHLSHARLSLAHGLTLMEKEKSLSLARKHLKAIKPAGCFSTNFGKSFHTEDHKAKIFSGKQLIVHEGVKEMKSIGFWVCGVLLSCLYGDFKPYLELRKIVGGFDGSLVATLDSKISEKIVKNKLNFSEIEEINNFVAHLVAGDDDDADKELQRKLCEFEKLFGDISKEVDHLFDDVMSQRSKLIDGFRLKK
ncbi:UPF0496 protein 4-like [Trifolium pratense]|uniref:Uncharacterized protein n=1 Tax=Trifolium pratense TaxID=57577 RepID=A0ACB0J2C4_TRIPR|nr:UPF0496 protein 4-like [Trifolium pratense]CAJ2639063.1 unnamed protein product [Trifolium pratense]